MAITQEQVIEQLKNVIEPDQKKDIVSLGMIKNVAVCDGKVKVSVELTTPAHLEVIQKAIIEAVNSISDEVGGVEAINVAFSQKPPAGGGEGGQQSPQAGAQQNNPLPGVKHIIAVGAGKGGVGKSTVSVNLAVGLARRGFKVGLLDGDIYGPSVPTLLNLHDVQVRGSENTLIPFEVHGIKTMTLGKLVEPNKPLIWRGPMAHGAFQQLALQTEWGDLDYLIVDLPPGTGDVPLTLAQILPLTGAVIVCTPQKLAQDDAVRAVGMFKQLEIDVLGVVENMSYFIGDDGKEYDLFGKGGAGKMAEGLGLAMLGQLPINIKLRENCDSGNPSANFDVDDALTGELNSFVDQLIKRVEDHDATHSTPTLSFS